MHTHEHAEWYVGGVSQRSGYGLGKPHQQGWKGHAHNTRSWGMVCGHNPPGHSAGATTVND